MLGGYLLSDENDSQERKKCKYDPFPPYLPCYQTNPEKLDCLICQLFMIRGVLYRLVMDFESYAKLTTIDMVERILKRELTENERSLVEKWTKDGILLSEIVKRLKAGL